MSKPETPHDISVPTFLMCPPYTLSNREANNALMDESDKPVNKWAALRQFQRLYNFLASQGFVYLLPPEGDYQDIPFVANIGCTIPHRKKPTLVLANFKSPPRRGEDKVARKFFELMEYEMWKPKNYFEGEADLKYLHSNIWFGAYGIRTSLAALHEISDKYDCDITPIHMGDPKLYHIDCVMFPLDRENVLVTTSVLDKNDVKKIAQQSNIIDVPKKFAYSGITNMVRVYDTLCCRNTGHDEKIWLNDMASRNGLKMEYFELDSFNANGADLSCLCLCINRPSFSITTKASIGDQVKAFFTGK